MALWLAVSITTALAAVPPSSRPQPEPSERSAADQGTRRKVRTPELSQDGARTFILAGTIMTAISTWSSGMIASRYLDSTSAAKQGMGRALAIPFLGPIAVAAAGTRTQAPIAMLGVMQGAGLSFLTIGTISASRHRRLGHDRHAPKRKHSTGVLALTQGVMWLSITWGMTYGFSRPRARQGETFARRLQAPLIGGLWAAPRASSYTRGYLGLTSSAVQIASASAVVFGAVVLGKHRKQNNLSVIPVPTPDGAKLVAAVRF